MFRIGFTILIWLSLIVAHLRTSRKKGSHPEKSHGTGAGFGIDGPKARRGRLADKGQKIVEENSNKKK